MGKIGFDAGFYKLSETVAPLKYDDLLPHKPNSQQETREFLQKIVDVLMDYVELSFNREEPVLDFHKPECLKEKLDMNLGEESSSLENLVADCANTLKYQVKSGHPRFMNQLSNGLDIISMAGDWLTATANCNMSTYEISPVFMTMEQYVLEKMRNTIGYSGGESTFTPGGSMGNLYAVLLALFQKFPEVKSKGISSVGGDLVIFTSNQSHSSLKKAATVAGIGLDNCVVVDTDEEYKMIPAELDRLITEQKEAGKHPIMVNATGGTRVTGVFDPLEEIAEICKKHDVWMHVDASWGGGILLSQEYRNPRLTGIELADSVTWSPNTLMGTTLRCSTFHTKHDGILDECNKIPHDHLYLSDKTHDMQDDSSDKLVHFGRQNDVFKLWLQWRSRGDAGYAKRMDLLMELTQHLVNQLKEQNDKFHLMMEPEFVNVCFWYIPKRLRDMPHDESKEKALGLLCPRIKSRLMKAGTMMIGCTNNLKSPNFLRCVISQEGTTEDDIDFMLKEIDRVGEDL